MLSRADAKRNGDAPDGPRRIQRPRLRESRSAGDRAALRTHAVSGLPGFGSAPLAADHAGCLELTRGYHGAMLDLGATSFWEDFDHTWIANTARIDEIGLDGRQQFPLGFGRCSSGVAMSLCHAWSCGVTAWLSEHVLGIRPILPGCRVIEVDPHLCSLAHSRGDVSHASRHRARQPRSERGRQSGYRYQGAKRNRDPIQAQRGLRNRVSTASSARRRGLMIAK